MDSNRRYLFNNNNEMQITLNGEPMRITAEQIQYIQNGYSFQPYTITYAPDAPVVKKSKADEHFKEQKKAIDAFLVLIEAQVRGLLLELFSGVLTSLQQHQHLSQVAAKELEDLMDEFECMDFLEDDSAKEARKFIMDTLKKPREDCDKKEIEQKLFELSHAMRENLLTIAQENRTGEPGRATGTPRR